MYPTVAHILLEDFTCDSCYYNHKTRAKRVTCADHGHTATQGLVAQGLVDHHSGIGFPERKTSPVTAAITATGRRRGALTDVGFSEMYSAIPDNSTHPSGHHAISHHSNRHRCTIAGRGQDDRRLADGLRAWSDGPELFGTGILPDDDHQEKQVLGLRLSVFRCKTCYQVIPCGGQLRCCPHGLGFSILCDS